MKYCLYRVSKLRAYLPIFIATSHSRYGKLRCDCDKLLLCENRQEGKKLLQLHSVFRAAGACVKERPKIIIFLKDKHCRKGALHQA